MSGPSNKPKRAAARRGKRRPSRSAARVAAYLHAHGIGVQARTFEAMVASAVEQHRRTLYGEPRRELTTGEAATLARGGFDLEPRPQGRKDPLALAAAETAGLLKTALSTAEAARRLGVATSRIRQRLGEGSILGIREGGRWLLPDFQFEGEALLPGLGDVLPRLSSDLHPLAVYRWFTRPSTDLPVPDGMAALLGKGKRQLSPREWLRVGLPPAAVAELAAGL